MNAKAAKKLRREARRALADLARPEVRWFARPLMLRLWFRPAGALARFAARLGWRSMGVRWIRFALALPDRAVRHVVKGAA